MGLVAEQPGAGGLQEGLGLEEVEVPASVGGEDGESGVVEGGDGVVEGYAGDNGQVEEASGGGAHDLRRGGIHAAPRKDDGVGSGGIGGTITLAAYGYWIREKGWTTPRFMRVMRLDNRVAYIVTEPG